ncbi:TetR/AcrR family transcriptional regulator [Rugosimonospora acidiphila]|uniref:TetR/AcrR family transcriptional regulator n=1 Tax=Rugosimonospora acidiphila TaxID=556531 RepID=A0ABP9SFI9_9ACTN
MTRTSERRRAPGMSQEQRRAMIVAAALPLVAEHGTAVTTSQIARAAGIGEATIFRAFADKDEVLDECMAEAARPDHVLRELASIPLDQPLAARLTDAIEALRGHLARMGAVAGALHSSGHRRPGARPAPNAREESMNAVRDSVAELLEPDRAALRFAPELVASAFLGLLFTHLRRPDDEPGSPAPADLVDILLFGARTQDRSAT